MSGKNSVTRTGGGAGGTPAARSRQASTVGETATTGPVRGYTKLSDAARAFNFDFRGKVVLDIGSSTGGFTKYALDHGAKKVIAVEKGTNQMLEPLRYDDRIELHEKTDIFDVKINFFENRLRRREQLASEPRNDGCERSGFEKKLILIEMIDIILADVSFISLTKVLKYAKIHLARSNTDFLVMLKPQFEASPDQLHKGVVKNESIRRAIIKHFERWLKQNGFIIKNKRDNILKGKTGNLERFYHLKLAK